MIHPRFREVEPEYDDDSDDIVVFLDTDAGYRYLSGSHAVAERYAAMADYLEEKKAEAQYGDS